MIENEINYIAHVRKDGVKQSLSEHLIGVAELSHKYASKIGLGDIGELIGLLHDVGKYSKTFQDYIKSAEGIINPDDDAYIDSQNMKGKIDHSTAGAQIIWEKLSSGNSIEKLLGQIIAVCLVSHHSGLIDCLATNSEGTNDVFTKRINKNKEKTYLKEIIENNEILIRLDNIINDKNFRESLEIILKNIFNNLPEKNQQSIVFQFQLGFLVRFLFSCLIDADRQDSADFEKFEKGAFRQNGFYQSWNVIADKLEKRISEFGEPKTDINIIRKNVSDQCLSASQKKKGYFLLTVPTGGGKTLASLRFALHHANKYNLDRILYIVPFTSIIDQNASVVRDILETSVEEYGRIVLEHHSNIGAEQQTWKEKLLTENWDAPVVYTTMVQFLEALFGGGTRGVRRLHQLSNSVIIFDEIQILPVKCVHLFCNAVNFLVNQCGSSVVLCTATQPLLNKVDPVRGALLLNSGNEIISNTQVLFDELKRVHVLDSRKPQGWTDEEITELAINEVLNSGSCLVIVNMKRSARSLFNIINEKTNIECYHLSTGMCPAHRKEVLQIIRDRIKPENNQPTLCISTQLIEAGVDIDFGSVIRYSAGLDSIAQAAGRCNRNGKRDSGNVYIVNPVEENINYLKDIAIGKEKAERVLNDFQENPGKYNNDPIGPALLEWYYRNYFFERKNEMVYPVTDKDAGRTDSLLNMLSSNNITVGEFIRVNKKYPDILLYQSFMTAGQFFKSIDAPTQSVVVQYGEEGHNLVNQLCSSFDLEKQYNLLKKIQQYSVNLFPHEFKKLSEEGAFHRVQEDTDIFYLDKIYYSNKFGISMEPVEEGEFLYA